MTRNKYLGKGTEIFGALPVEEQRFFLERWRRRQFALTRKIRGLTEFTRVIRIPWSLFVAGLLLPIYMANFKVFEVESLT
jgi:hypothetical protein